MSTTQSAPSELEMVREFIRNGRFPEDGRLPPERELAPMLGLTRNQIRSAFRKLEKEGLIWRHVGKGTFIGRKPVAGTEPDQFAVPLADLSNPREVIEARLLVEPLLARLAAMRASARDIDVLEQILKKQAVERDPYVFQKLDRSWHSRLASASGNNLIASFLETVHQQTDPNIWSRLTELYMTSDRMTEAVGEHRSVLDAIKARDGAGAEERMRQHIRSVRTHTLGDFD